MPMQETNVLAIVKPSGEEYIFFYTDEEEPETIMTFCRFASNPELSFNWDDYVTLSKRIRERSQRQENLLRFTGNLL